MKIDLKKVLLTGTAIVAVSTFAAQAQAAQAAPGATVSTTGTNPIVTDETGSNGTSDGGNDAANLGGDGIVLGAGSLGTSGTPLAINSNLTGGNGGSSTAAGDTQGAGGAGFDFSTFTTNVITFGGTTKTIHGGNGGSNSHVAAAGSQAASVGGAGGAGVLISATGNTITDNNATTGGTGGNGLASTDTLGAAGGIGGDAIDSTATNSTITTGAAITGGTGGNGGNGGTGTAGAGANGGNGIDLTSTGAVVHVTAGTVAGGLGGNAGTGAVGANAGTGGAGITGAANTITLDSGTIVHGGAGGTASGAGTTADGDGIDITGATTSLSNAGTIFGGAVAASAANAVKVTAVLGTLVNSGTIGTTTATGSAVNIGGGGKITTFTNTGGTIETDSTGVGNAALVIGADEGAGGVTLNGGTIKDVNAGANTGVAVNIGVTQSGTITNSATITSNGTGTDLGVGVNFAGNATLTNSSSGAINGQITESGNQVVALNNSGTIAGVITLNGTGGTTITSNAGSITGNINMTGNVANAFTMNGGTVSGGTVTFGAGADTITLAGGTLSDTLATAGGTNVLNVTGNFTTGATITTTGAVNTTVSAAKTFTVDNVVGLGTGTITDTGTITLGTGGTITTSGATGIAGTLNVNSNGSSVGALTDSGTIDIAAAKTLTASSYVGGAGTLQINLGTSAAASGGVLALSGVYSMAPTHLLVDVASTGSQGLTAGSSYNIVTSNGAATNFNQANITDDSYIYDFSTAVVGGDNIALTVVQAQSFADATANSNNATSATVLLNSLATSTDPDVILVRNKLVNDDTRASFNNDLAATQPTEDGGNMIAALGVTDQTFDITDERMADARLGNDTGIAAGNSMGAMFSGAKIWVQGFGQHADQDSRDGNEGYRANTFGGAAGIDSASILDNSLLGLDFSYGRSTVDSNDTNSTTDDIDSYQLTLYGSTKFNTGVPYINKLFVDGMVAYAYDHNDETRHDVGGVAGLDANSDFGANQVAARLSTGEDFHTYFGTTLTPSILGDYLYYNANSYTESGAGGAGLHVDQDSYNQLDFGLDLKAGWSFKMADGSSLKPDAHVGYRYNVLNNDVDASSTFNAGGPSFSTDGLKPGRNTFNAGLDLKFATVSNWEFTGSYDFEGKDRYISNTGLLRAAYKF